MKRSLSDNFKPRTASPQCAQGDELHAPSDGAAGTAALGLTDPTAKSGTNSGRVRHDTIFLQPSEAEERKNIAANLVENLSATAATDRKKELLADSDGAAVQLHNGTSFTIVCLDSSGLHLCCLVMWSSREEARSFIYQQIVARATSTNLDRSCSGKLSALGEVYADYWLVFCVFICVLRVCVSYF